MEAIRTMEEVHTTIVALRMVMGMDETTVRAVPILRHPPRRILVTLPVSSAGRPGTMPLNVPRQRMEMEMKALERSPTLSPKVG